MPRRITAERLHLFDTSGMDGGTIRTLYLILVAIIGGISFTNITTGVALIGYTKELGASDFAYGLIVALIPLANAFQFVVSYLLERRLERVKTFIIAGYVQRLLWIPIGLIPFILPMSAGAMRLWSAGLLMFVAALTYPVTNVTFFSICADVVPPRIRGRYFGVRSRVSTCASFICGILTGLLLDRLPGFAGYAVAFCIAGVLGALDITCFFAMKMPPMKRTAQNVSLGRMLGNVTRDANYMRLCLFGALWYFGVYLSSPFCTVFARSEMRMTNMQIILMMQIVSNAFSILTVPRWGRAMDRFGNRPVVVVTTLMSACVPLIWSFIGPNRIFLFLLSHAISGMSWAAFEVGAQNLFMGQAKAENRSMYFAVYFLGTQLFGIALSNAVGGWLLDNPFTRLEALGSYFCGVRLTRYHYLFMLSAVLRFSALLMLRVLKETGSQNTLKMVKTLAAERVGGLTKRLHIRRTLNG